MSRSEHEREDANPLWTMVSLLLVVRAAFWGNLKDFQGEN